MTVLASDYCRAIETYLCQKNDGHLIRVVGPSFEMVSRWAADGVPLKVACRGIDRCFERYYRKGPRRRPIRIDFCEADVLDVFDEWRRATGLTAGAEAGERARPQESLPAHLERAVMKLSSAGVVGAPASLGDRLADFTSRVSAELDAARANRSGLRGEARRALVARLAALDEELAAMVRAALDEPMRVELERDADEELAGFRSGMPEDGYRRARARIVDRIARERFGLPSLAL